MRLDIIGPEALHRVNIMRSAPRGDGAGKAQLSQRTPGQSGGDGLGGRVQRQEGSHSVEGFNPLAVALDDRARQGRAC
ncbi:hypothetical protein [Falsigemmobacter faecalis]|uniref:Uncharacterized protein n=1 Tax=Falsigemmobacter faecalis TaxID=2488730 RepID=A0A3P3DFH8_9RHOB|nr:hypothetical protein [Falsigemmobacter faecalis]RRH73027.1 hypothetical protein EG244_13815 [Falsigemmobacter faecalis]